MRVIKADSKVSASHLLSTDDTIYLLWSYNNMRSLKGYFSCSLREFRDCKQVLENTL